MACSSPAVNIAKHSERLDKLGINICSESQTESISKELKILNIPKKTNPTTPINTANMTLFSIVN